MFLFLLLPLSTSFILHSSRSISLFAAYRDLSFLRGQASCVPTRRLLEHATTRMPTPTLYPYHKSEKDGKFVCDTPGCGKRLARGKVSPRLLSAITKLSDVDAHCNNVGRGKTCEDSRAPTPSSASRRIAVLVQTRNDERTNLQSMW